MPREGFLRTRATWSCFPGPCSKNVENGPLGSQVDSTELVRRGMRGFCGERMLGTKPDAACRAGGRGTSREPQEGTMQEFRTFHG